MNTLGHPYVAFKVTGRMNPYLVAGSHLPDLVPFVPNSVFSFEEIHESPEKLLKFLDSKYPHARDLALGMMSHSVKFGADKFNRDIEDWLIKNEYEKMKLARKIVDCSDVNVEMARKSRLHNYLWSGIDVYILSTKPKFIEDLANLHREINRGELAILLAEGFGKDKKEVKRMVDYLLVPIKPEFLTTLDGLVKIWKIVLAGLPEKDKINEEKTARLFTYIYERFENQWEDILKTVVSDVRIRMESFLGFRLS